MMNIIFVAAVMLPGIVTGIDGERLTLRTCDGNVIVDASAAFAAEKSVPIAIGKNVIVLGELEGDIFKAISISNKRLTCGS